MYSRSNYITQKPENALKRINELISSSNGADREKRLGLDQLRSLLSLSSKRKRESSLSLSSSSKVLESVMKRYLELCVDLKDHRAAKDGLHQYRNIVQNVDPASLEVVIVHLIELAETRANVARVKANKVALAAAAKISDLEQEETPESIMLSTMTVEGLKDRTDRGLVVPWLKLLWETYRAVLELLHKNVKLERVYLKTCEKAFAFCLEYHRTLEFRRLCDMLRQQMSNIQKQFQSPVPLHLQNLKFGKNYPATPADWTAESIEIQLQIRFLQLEVATTLEQWNEGFRTVEDIYSIMQFNKKVPKPKLMSIYYEKLTRIFWYSENYLFHAYAWSKYYQLYSEYKKENMKVEEKNHFASCVLLSALCIPNIHSTISPASIAAGTFASSSGSSTTQTYDDDEIIHEKNQQMALLLDFQSNPTREALLEGIIAKGILGDVYPEIHQLYLILETKFCPLTMIQDIQPFLASVKSNPLFSQYSASLQRVIVLRCVRQVSSIYTTFKITSLAKLIKPLDFSLIEVEKILVDASSSGRGRGGSPFHVSIDHSIGCYRFGAQAGIGPVVDTQIATIGKQLQQIVQRIEQSNQPMPVAAVTPSDYFSMIRKAYEHEKSLPVNYIIERKMIIERRKEGLERLQKDRLEKEDKRKQEEEELRRKEEEKRLKLEEEIRAREKVRKLQDQISVQRIKKQLEALGKNVDESVLKDLDEKGRRDFVKTTQEQIQKEKEEDARKLSEQAKQLDYFTRAVRIDSRDRIVAKYQDQERRDREAYEAKVAQFMIEQSEKHAVDLETKLRLSRTLPFRSEYEKDIIALQKQAYDERVIYLKQKALVDHRNRKITRARYLKDQEDERIQLELEMEQEREALKLAEEARIAAEYEELRKKREQEIRDREDEEIRKKKEKASVQPVPVPRRGLDDEEDDGGGWTRAGGGRDQSVRDREQARGPPRDESFDRRDEPREDGGKWGRERRDEVASDRFPPRERREEPREKREEPREEGGRWGRERRDEVTSDRIERRELPREEPRESREEPREDSGKWVRGPPRSDGARDGNDRFERREEPREKREEPREEGGRWGRERRDEGASDRFERRELPREQPRESRLEPREDSGKWGRGPPRSDGPRDGGDWGRSRGPPADRSGPPPDRSGPPLDRSGPPPDRSGPPSNDGWRTVGPKDRDRKPQGRGPPPARERW